MQLIYWDKKNFKEIIEIFDNQRNVLQLSTHFPSQTNHPNYFNEKKRILFKNKRLGEKNLLLNNKEGISDTGIFDLKKETIFWKNNETFMSKKYKSKGYSIGIAPKFLSAFIPWPPLTRRNVNENSFKFNNNQILKIKNYNYYKLSNTTKEHWYENLIFPNGWYALQPYSFTDLDIINIFKNILKNKDINNKKLEYVSKSSRISVIMGFFAFNCRPNLYYFLKKLILYLPLRILKKFFL